MLIHIEGALKSFQVCGGGVGHDCLKFKISGKISHTFTPDLTNTD